MKKKYIYITSSLLLTGLLVLALFFIIGISKDRLHFASGQIGITTKSDVVLINDIEYQTYQTTDKNILLNFETYNMYEEFDNHIIINDNHQINIKPANSKQNDYVGNQIDLLGLNIINGKIKVTFKVGKNNKDIFDTFWLRNVYLEFEGNIIKSNDDKNITYNRVINMGSKDLKSPLRIDYVDEITFDFEINSKLLKKKGTIFNANTENLNITTKKTKVLSNPTYISISSNIINNEIITENTNINVLFSHNVKEQIILLNGLEISNNLKLNKNAWAVGDNKLEIIAINEYGFIKTLETNFTLSADSIDLAKLDYQAYNQGVDELENGLKVGKEISNIKGFKSAFTKESNISFIVNDGDNKNLVWEGKSIQNRVVSLEIFNYDLNKWEVKSTMSVENKDAIITLGYNYEGEENYIKNNKVNVRIVSRNITTDHYIDKYIYHSSDVQYISRNGTVNVSNISERAKESLNEMANHMIEMYQKDLLEYVSMTGDFVQSTVKSGAIEYPIVMDNLINPLLNANVPLGVVSGNHDIGALNENTIDGSDTLDEFLIYDLWNEHLGEDKFKDKYYYGGSFENNRSHYDLIEINNHEFLFLYLGWGSSIKGIHVSEKDIDYAKGILEQYPNKTVIIGLHDYMGNKSKRTVTGEYVYNQLVKEYSNIKFVLSGHVNGSSAMTDYLDDNKDGINDRRVFQILTDFQEEGIENLGATFIRRIGLDFTNNRLNFDIYSPVTNDYQIFVNNNSEYVKEVNNYNYDFDLSNNGFGLITLGFGV